MALTVLVEERLKELFEQKSYYTTKNKSIEAGLHDYFKYRNLICEEIFNNIKDLTEVKQKEWWNKHKLDEGAVMSIISDSIFKSVDTFNERRNNKFVTFFYFVLNSTLKNHLKYLTTKGRTSFFNEASFKDAAEKEFQKKGIKSRKAYERNIERMYTMSEKLDCHTIDNFNSVMNAKDYSDYMLRQLSGNEYKVLRGILDGGTHQEIAKRLKISRAYVTQLFGKIQRKFKHIEDELCHKENLS